MRDVTLEQTWREVQQAWAAGDRSKARTMLAHLIAQTTEAPAERWRLWADTAAALGDLALAARAYTAARESLLPEQSPYLWLNRCLYAQLHTGVAVQDIARAYAAAPRAEGDEDGLLGLGLEAELAYHTGHQALAATLGKELAQQLSLQESVAFEFLSHVRPRLWLLLARLAEEAGDIVASRHYLSQIEPMGFLGPGGTEMVDLLRLLLEPSATGVVGDPERLISLLAAALNGDFSAVRPPVAEPLLNSLQLTHDALANTTERLTLLTAAIKRRPTNVLARQLYIAELEQQGKPSQSLLTAEGYLWLTVDAERAEKSIGQSLSRPAASGKPRFAFCALGGGEQIGGSAYLVDLNGTRVLLDVGLDVNTSPDASYRRFKQGLAQSGIVTALGELAAVLVSHAHMDHIGLLPALHADPDLPRFRTPAGPRPQVRFYATEATREIARLMLEDTVRMAQRMKTSLPYTVADVTAALEDLQPPRDGQLDLFEDLGQVHLLESGHILGSRMILLEKDGWRVLYTGDCNTRPQFTVPACATVKDLRPDVLILENTYGYSDDWLLPREWQEAAFIAHLDRVLRRGGTVLLPSFAVGRAQEVLGLVAEHARRCPDLYYPIYLDGLARGMTHCYDRFDRELSTRYREARAWIASRLNFVGADADPETVLDEQIRDRPAVIIASSGMLQPGSASYRYAQRLAHDSRNAIFYTGYLAEDSEALSFLSNTTDSLTDLESEQRRFYFSAHAPKADLLQFVLAVQPRAVILVHGEAHKGRQHATSLYALLRRLEETTLQVFVGQAGRKIIYQRGRFEQQ